MKRFTTLLLTIVITSLLVISFASVGLLAEVSGDTGAIQLDVPTTGYSVIPEQNTDNSNIKVFNEQQGYALTADLAIDQNDNTLEPDPSAIPAGTVVNSHFIHFDNVGTTTGVRLTGTITFDGPILGVITQDSTLWASDYLGHAEVTYPASGSFLYRGLEQGTGGVGDYPSKNWNNQDTISISGNTLTLNLQCNNVLDQLRVITEYVPSEIDVYVDIKPQSCPNPLNVGSGGVVSVAILGTEAFDITQVDPATVMLEGVSPLRWSIEDVATPYTGEMVDCMSGTTEGPDGFADLVFKFDKQELITAIGEVSDGECLLLTLTGKLFDTTDISGSDFVRIIDNTKDEAVSSENNGKEDAPGQNKAPGEPATGKGKVK